MNGKNSAILFVTNSAPLLKRVQAEIAAQLATLSRQEALAGVLEKDCALILVKSLKDAVAIANEFAPEHIAIVTKEDDKIAAQIVNVPALTLNDMGGKADAAMRSKNFVTLDGTTISVQIGSTVKHQHPQGNEIQYIIDGTGKFWLGDKEFDVKPGDRLYLPPEQQVRIW